MKVNSKVRAVVACVFLAAAAAQPVAANSVVVTDWGTDPFVLQNSFREVSGTFSELFLFNLSGPAVGSFTATSVIVSLQGRPLYDFRELNMAVYSSGVDAVAGTADDTLLAAAPAVGTQANLADLALGAGNYALRVSGDTSGLLGGAYVSTSFVSAVPEPQTYALLLAGLGAVVLVSRRRERADGTAGAPVHA